MTEKKPAMPAATREALLGSIAKWEKIVEGHGQELGWYNCPLCELFYADNCKGCPVAEKTEKICCDGTPYKDFGDIKWDAQNEANDFSLHSPDSFSSQLSPCSHRSRSGRA